VPEPLGRGQRYMPGLDGLRAIAVAAVIAFHLGLSWAPGGLLGVGVFFTLSGYLITDLLLGSWESSGGLKLRDFWARRARRLLPALFVMLAVVTVWVAIASPSQLGALRGDVGAASVYVSNWWLAFQHVSYFARFGPPSPLGHLWSLAVEEQFYLIWPWLVWLGLIWLVRRRYRTAKRAQASAALVEGDGADVLAGNGGAPVAQGEYVASGETLSAQASQGNTLVEQRPPAEAVTHQPEVRFVRREMWPLAGATLILAVLSAVEMAVLYHPSFDPSRIYDGTDTRAFGLLFGAALAMVWPSRGLRAHVSPAARRFIDGMGAVGLLVIAILIWRTNEYSAFLYRGGMVLLSLATCLVVAAVAHPAGRIGRVLGARPLRWTGVRSYGIYLWHYPVIVLTTATVVTGTDLTRDFFQVVAIVLIADLSWRYIETPVRHGALGRLWVKMRSIDWRRFATLPRANRIALTCVPVGVLVLTLSLAGVMPSAPSGVLAVASAPSSPQLVTATTDLLRASTATTGRGSASGAGTGQGATNQENPAQGASTATTSTATTSPSQQARGTAKGAGGTSTPLSTTPPGTSAPSKASSVVATKGGGGLRTSCSEVAHLGDSTSESLISPEYLPDPSQRLGAEYARVGVSRSLMEIVGANSIVETLPGDEDGYQIAQSLVAQGYRGCWVIALGTNDTADVYVGSRVGLAARIKRMMSVIGNEPVLWVNVKSLLSSGPYSESDMQNWDNALLAACSSYPNMRVFNWAGMAQPGWFISDGIHYTSAGSAARAAAIADALATAFPAVTSTSASANSHAKNHNHKNTAASCVVNGSPSWHLPAFQY
jgi:peptidoglycan/LPS O-acetylase OafA/YrhL